MERRLRQWPGRVAPTATTSVGRLGVGAGKELDGERGVFGGAKELDGQVVRPERSLGLRQAHSTRTMSRGAVQVRQRGSISFAGHS